MKDLRDAYTVVKELMEAKRISISENELSDYADAPIILSLLKSKYNAKYEPPFDPHCCGDYRFDNPFVPKTKWYILQYCFFNSDTWEQCAMIRVNAEDKEDICNQLIRLDFDEKLYYDKNRLEQLNALKKELFNKLITEKIFVGNRRYWRLKIIDFYDI